MNIPTILYTVIISPIETVIEAIFCLALNNAPKLSVVHAIAAVSLAVSILTLPIYNVADAIQQKERNIQQSMANGIKRIKETFKGDERFMMLQTFYRENKWHPLYAFRASLSIIIEVPFFIAAYHFLSHCPALQGAYCGILRDLGKPDGLVAFSAGGGLTLNLLPILMTAINVISSAVYLKGYSIREKAQTYCLAVIFLVLLYNSPSGLVLYWTLNNVFGLGKNIVQKLLLAHLPKGTVSCNKIAGTFYPPRWSGLQVLFCAANTVKKVSYTVASDGVAVAVHCVPAVGLVLTALILMAYRMGLDGGPSTIGDPGKYQVLFFVLAVLWCVLPLELDALRRKRKALIAHISGALLLALVSAMLIVHSMVSFGKPGNLRLALFVFSIIWAALPFERDAFRGNKKSYICHALCASVLSILMLLLCVARFAARGNPGEFRTLLLALSMIWMALPIEKQAVQGGKKAMLSHLAISGALLLWALTMCMICVGHRGTLGQSRLMFLLASVMWLSSVPLLSKKNTLLALWQEKHNALSAASKQEVYNHDGSLALFLSSCAGLTILCGLLLPASTIATDPEQFSFVGAISSPMCYVQRSVCVFTGLFVLWPLVIYKMFYGRTRRTMPYLAAFLFIMALLNAYPLGFNYGMMDNTFRLNDAAVLQNETPFYTRLFWIAAAVAVVLLFVVYKKRWGRRTATLCMAVCAAECALSVFKVQTISRGFNECSIQRKEDERSASGKLETYYHLSKNGKNVVVLFMDTAISSYFPYIVQQFPELASDFDGFVYYPNTVSFSNSTMKASSALMGGYEYTPEGMNEQSTKLLPDKRDEAMRLAALLFSDAGWYVTITDPPLFECYPKGIPPFDEYPKIRYGRLRGKYAKRYMAGKSAHGKLAEKTSDIIASHIISYAAMQVYPPFARNIIYDKGHYLTAPDSANIVFTCKCLPEFAHLYYLGDITDCNSDKNTYTLIGSYLTHQESILDENGYVPPVNGVDINKATAPCYENKANPDENDIIKIAHYHVNTAAMLQTARYLNRLKEMGCYDNTRIIIVADHGRRISTPAFSDGSYSRFNVLFLMKDFNAHGKVKTDNTFMTNADTLFLSKQGLPISDINPFTGKSISAAVDKREVRIYPATGRKDFNETNLEHIKNRKLWITGKECHPLRVHDNIFDSNNWERIQ